MNLSADPAAAARVRIEARGVVLGYRDRRVIDGLDLTLPAGAVTAIVGPNACGKSTLLRGLARLQPLMAGSVSIGGDDVRRLPRRELARRIAVLPQSPTAPEGVRVAELVARGRFPHRGWLGRPGAADDAAVARALASTGVSDLAERRVEELSGGQRQRVWVAMALAQETAALLLDEPTTYLDLAHQVELLELLRELNGRDGTTVVMVLHELSLAARYADHLVVLAGGRLVAQGAPADVLTAEVVHEAFGLDAVVMPDPVAGAPLVVPR